VRALPADGHLPVSTLTPRLDFPRAVLEGGDDVPMGLGRVSEHPITETVGGSDPASGAQVLGGRFAGFVDAFDFHFVFFGLVFVLCHGSKLIDSRYAFNKNLLLFYDCF